MVISQSAVGLTAQPATFAVEPLVLRLPSDWVLTDERLLELCSLNEIVPFEVDETGALIVGLPSGPTGEWIGVEIASQLHSWMDAEAGDLVFGSSAFFRLPDGNRRSPDVAWASGERLVGVDRFDGKVWSLVPDFVMEIRSLTDDIEELRAKMEMWIANGARLGWLLDPFEERLWVYRTDREPEELVRPMQIGDGEVLSGLEVDLSRFWRPR